MTPQTYPSFERSAKWQRSFYKPHIYHIRNIKVPRNTVPSCIVHQETYYNYFYFNYYFTKIHLLKKGDQNIRVQQNNAGCRLFYRINKMKFFFYSFINFVCSMWNTKRIKWILPGSFNRKLLLLVIVHICKLAFAAFTFSCGMESYPLWQPGSS